MEHFYQSSEIKPTQTGRNRPHLQQHFDQQALSYEKYLLRKLKYRVPLYLGKILVTLYHEQYALDSCLDAGCGPGTCATLLRPLFHRLIGVDFSEQMLHQANKKQLYDDLIQDDVFTYLRSRESAFQMILCTDVLVYAGDIRRQLQILSQALSPDGYLVFSFQTLPLMDHPLSYKQLHYGRYAHNPDFVLEALGTAQLQPTLEQDLILRFENDNPVFGQIIVAQKSKSLRGCSRLS